MKNNFLENGYCVIDNFLPNDIANDIETLFKEETEWEKINQVRENHYKHVFKMNSEYFPSSDEEYLARFSRSENLEKETKLIFDKYFKPKINELSNEKLNLYDVRCYSHGEGDFFRTHIDDYAGSIGCVYYCNKNWCWDWGGILHIGQKDDELLSIFPKFNRIVIHDMKKFRFPHFISPITHYAKNNRFTIVSFNRS
tara:strand:+ start:215 stop:805 length:591 start_codon:yes stop_codon:yes gene_type:complete